MSAVIAKLFCSIIMSITGLIVVKNISDSKETLISKKTVILMLILIILPIIFRNSEYSYLYTIMTYVATIIVYKYILCISYTRAIITSAILYLSLFILEFSGNRILVSFITISEAMNNQWITIASNIIFSAILIIVYINHSIKNKLIKFVNKLEDRKGIHYIIFFLLLIIVMSISLYTLSINYKINKDFYILFSIPVIFFILLIILINERNNYEKLHNEYDYLFNYVKVFEEWIEKEQLNRHEYKNQLAVLRCMTREKKVKSKIDEIIADNINIDGQIINQLKNLPNGGFKGLLYYKIAVARDKKINIEVDVSPDAGPTLKKLTKEELKIIFKLIGIYCDNAIEAAQNTKKKIVLIEIYEFNQTANIVISNTFKKEKLLINRFEKGISTKGKDRGNGLYFARKLLLKNSWVEEHQEIIDGYYIETLKIKKED